MLACGSDIGHPIPKSVSPVGQNFIVDGILYANEFERPDYNVMLSKVRELVQKYNPNKILIDGANPEFIRSLKIQLSENPDYDKVIARYKEKKINWESFAMKVLPVNFRQEHKAMLSHCKMLLEDGCIAINPAFSKLVTSLRTAVENDGILGQGGNILQ